MDTFNHILKTLEDFRRNNRPVPAELRMHPADIDDLRREAEPHLVARLPSASGVEFAGVKIIADVDAQRLPRKSQEA